MVVRPSTTKCRLLSCIAGSTKKVYELAYEYVINFQELLLRVTNFGIRLVICNLLQGCFTV